MKTRVLNGKDFRRALAEKLIEEAHEFAADFSLAELADVMEVVRAILDEKGLSMEDLNRARRKKLRSRGGFKKRFYLVHR